MDNLPTEFIELQGKIEYVTRASDGHYRSSCPECGAAGHSGRGKPDRFQMWLTSDTTGGPFGWCNRCGYKWWPGRSGEGGVDEETLRLLKQQAQAAQAERDERRRQKLAEYSTKEIWLEYCERMEEQNRQWWLQQGVPVDVQQYLSLGYIPDRAYKVGDEYYHSPAYTIPWFGENFDFLTMQYRLTDPFNPSDKYRFEYDLPGGKSNIFRADPADKIGDKVIVCEGAKKAMVTRYRLLPVNTSYVVIASAAKSTLEPVIEAVKDSAVVYLIMDPDGVRQAWQAAKAIGKAGHVVRLPYKIDDGFLQYGLQPDQFQRILNMTL